MTTHRPRGLTSEKVRARYDRLASLYDFMEAPMERRFGDWRRRLWAEVRGPAVLEVGVGTGANIPFYPEGMRVTAIDLSPRMLAWARRRASRAGVPVDLRLMDAEHLEFEDDTFDSAVATCVFCSVADPVAGLREMGRVTRPDGRIVLLEHVRPQGALGRVADLLNPVVVRLIGPNINRPTVENVRRAGLEIERIDAFLHDIVRLIVARPGKPG